MGGGLISVTLTDLRGPQVCAAAVWNYRWAKSTILYQRSLSPFMRFTLNRSN